MFLKPYWFAAQPCAEAFGSVIFLHCHWVQNSEKAQIITSDLILYLFHVYVWYLSHSRPAGLCLSVGLYLLLHERRNKSHTTSTQNKL